MVAVAMVAIVIATTLMMGAATWVGVVLGHGVGYAMCLSRYVKKKKGWCKQKHARRSRSLLCRREQVRTRVGAGRRDLGRPNIILNVVKGIVIWVRQLRRHHCVLFSRNRSRDAHLTIIGAFL